jgi:hypothetical protein
MVGSIKKSHGLGWTTKFLEGFKKMICRTLDTVNVSISLF